MRILSEICFLYLRTDMLKKIKQIIDGVTGIFRINAKLDEIIRRLDELQKTTEQNDFHTCESCGKGRYLLSRDKENSQERWICNACGEEASAAWIDKKYR